MRLRSAMLMGVCVLSLPAGPGPTAAADATLDWNERPKDALRQAQESGRPVLVDAWAVWCAPCLLMDETTWVDPRVLASAAGFVPLKVDADAQQQFVDRYRVEAFPTVLFLDGDGHEIGRMTGFVAAADLVKRMHVVGARYADYLAARDRRDVAAAQLEVADYLLESGNPRGAGERLRRASKLVGSGDPPRQEAIELRLAAVNLAEGRLGAAAKRLERLSNSARDRSVRGEALSGLVQVERRRGREAAAAAAAARLREEYPDFAAEPPR